MDHTLITNYVKKMFLVDGTDMTVGYTKKEGWVGMKERED
jgi:hypothetical protein